MNIRARGVLKGGIHSMKERQEKGGEKSFGMSSTTSGQRPGVRGKWRGGGGWAVGVCRQGPKMDGKIVGSNKGKANSLENVRAKKLQLNFFFSFLYESMSQMSTLRIFS